MLSRRTEILLSSDVSFSVVINAAFNNFKWNAAITADRKREKHIILTSQIHQSKIQIRKKKAKSHPSINPNFHSLSHWNINTTIDLMNEIYQKHYECRNLVCNLKKES